MVICEQSWISEPSYKEVNPGGSVVLTCVIESLAGECRWSRQGSPIGIHKNKYEWAGYPKDGDCSLLVMDADEEFDSGGWQCSVTASSFRNKDALVSVVGLLVVRSAPTSVSIEHDSPNNINTKLKQNETIEVIENSNITMYCISEGGVPPPKISWIYPNTIDIIAIDNTFDDKLGSKLTATVLKSIELIKVSCQIEHDALEKNLEASMSISVQCRFVYEFLYPEVFQKIAFRQSFGNS